MNTIIKNQLLNCEIANIPEFKDDSISIIIPRGKRKQQTAELNKSYQIKLKDYIVNPSPGFSLHDNWNNGISPTCNNMNVEIIELLGEKMVKVRGVCIDTNTSWTGWLPRKSFKIIKEI